MKEHMPLHYYKRKANQHWEMAGLARQDRDMAEAIRHTKLAQQYDQKFKEYSSEQGTSEGARGSGQRFG